MILASLTKVKSHLSSDANSKTSQRKKKKEKAEMQASIRMDQLQWENEQNCKELQCQDKELHAVNEEVNKQC